MKKLLTLLMALLTVSVLAQPKEPAVPQAEKPVVAQPGKPAAAPAEYWTPLQLSLWNPVQLAPASWEVHGLRLSFLYSENRALSGLDLGLVNTVTHDTTGIQMGAFNWVGTSWEILMLDDAPGLDGIQLGGLSNCVAGRLRGMQWAGANSAATIDGLQVGGLNFALMATGIQIGVVNNGSLSVHGMQLGCVNTAQAVHGMQIGVINYCETMAGVQLGLCNVIRESPVPFFPIINAHF